MNVFQGIFLYVDVPFPLWIAAWKEILIVIFALALAILIFQKKIPFPKFDTLDGVITLYIVWALSTGFFRWGILDIERTIFGAKYSLLFLIFFLLVRHFPLKEEERNKFFHYFLGVAAITFFFGVFQKFLPQDFLVHFGYSPVFSDFAPGGPTSYCQMISFTNTCRLQSFFSGPNDFSAFLMFTLPLFFFLVLHPFHRKKEIQKNAPLRAFGATMFLIGIFDLVFAYSRSAWAGAIVSLTLGFIILFREKQWFKKTFWSLISLALVAFVSLSFFAHEFFEKVIIRISSNQGHFERSRDGILHILLHPFGTGLGDSGPASARFYANETGFIPESWYLQVGIDTGFPGLILFFMILFLLGKRLFQIHDWRGQALMCGLLGISIMAILLHSWESASVSLTFWGLAGILLSPTEKSGFFTKVKRFFTSFSQKIFRKFS